MKADPCSVCGGTTDVNLVDGFYYCVECGTQDVNAQETVVEQTVLADGTIAISGKRKIRVLKDAVEMTGEWHKWHVFNFVMSGLVDQLVALGASARFREIALWIWTRYMNKFTEKEKMGNIIEVTARKRLTLFNFIDEDENDFCDKNKENDDSKSVTNKSGKDSVKAKETLPKLNSIKVMTTGVMTAMLYLALNLDESDIQLSHLLWFIRERRIDVVNFFKFIPKELNVKSIVNWRSFLNSKTSSGESSSPQFISKITLALVEVLNIHPPLVPDFRKMVDNYVTELHLPNDFKDLVCSLIQAMPCDVIEAKCIKKGSQRLTYYDSTVMCYIIIALKMTFGLDDQYEIMLSDAVEKINEEKQHSRSHRFGKQSEQTERLLSFRDWSQYLLYRKMMLCRNYLPIARKHNLDVDDKVFIDQLEERKTRKIGLRDEVTMDILNKIDIDGQSAIPKSEFQASLTPFSSHAKVLLEYVQDPDIKLLLSEDFTQYSLKYACKDVKLVVDKKNVVKGASLNNKVFNKAIEGALAIKTWDSDLVYVRNCDNKNWVKTNPPTLEHITAVDDKDIDHGYDSNLENNLERNIEDHDVIDEIQKEKTEPEEERILESIEEEQEGVCIFDDAFDNVKEEGHLAVDLGEEHDSIELDNANLNGTINASLATNMNDVEYFEEEKFDPNKFRREETIKALLAHACKEYKVPMPVEYCPRNTTRKRKSAIPRTEDQEIKRKRVETPNKSDARQEVEKIMALYYANVEKDFFHQIAAELQTLGNRDESRRVDDNHSINGGFNEESIHDDLGVENNEENVSKTETNDPSVMEVEAENESADDLLPKTNPKFDEKTHDTNQLFLKYKALQQATNTFTINDPEIDEILNRQIAESALHVNVQDNNKKKNTSDTDDEDDVALSIIQEKKRLLAAKMKQNRVELKYLNAKYEVKHFHYWVRHYKPSSIRKCKNMTLRFDKELNENFPKSFTFVLQECASILDCTPYTLYQRLQTMEQMLLESYNLNQETRLSESVCSEQQGSK